MTNNGDGTVSVITTRDGCRVGHHRRRQPSLWDDDRSGRQVRLRDQRHAHRRRQHTKPGRILAPDGHAYVPGVDGTVSVITTATGEVSATIPVGNIPGAVAFTPDGKYAYVTNGGDGTVSVITTATGEVSATITVGSFPGSVTFTPDGKHAYVPSNTWHGVGDHDGDR